MLGVDDYVNMVVKFFFSPLGRLGTQNIHRKIMRNIYIYIYTVRVRITHKIAEFRSRL